MHYLLGSLTVLVMIGYPVILICGLIVCVRQRFVAGIWSFGILIVLQLYNLLVSYFVRNMLTSDRKFDWVSKGEFMMMINLVSPLIELLAVAILVYGLYRRWRGKPVDGRV